VINEPTASVFVIRRDRQQGWLTALVWHPRLGCWLPAGGHVVPDETPAQAAIREVLEFPVKFIWCAMRRCDPSGGGRPSPVACRSRSL
jgi:hypothetical protein